MIKRGMNRKAQFYIIAAIIIIAILIGIATYVNYARTKKGTRIYDLGKELGLETGYVYDYGTYQGENFDVLIDDWTDKYLDYTKGQEVIEDWIFLYGDTERMTAMTFTIVTAGTVEIITRGGSSTVEITTIRKTTERIDGGEDVKVLFQNLTYNFKLEKGENFFFVISSEGYVTGAEKE